MKQAIIIMLVSVACIFAGDGNASDGNFWTYIVGVVLGAGIGISVITKFINWVLDFVKTKVGSENYTKYMNKISDGTEVLSYILNDLKDGKVDNAEEIIERVKDLFNSAGNTELNTDELELKISSLKRKSGLGK